VLRGLLIESDMLTAISAHQLRYEIRDGSLVVLDFPLEQTRREIGLSLRLGAYPAPGARALMDEIRRVVAQSRDFRIGVIGSTRLRRCSAPPAARPTLVC
jgi:LysR family transcriptional regulator of gallate degradation